MRKWRWRRLLRTIRRYRLTKKCLAFSQMRGETTSAVDRLEKEASAVGNADMHQRTMASIVLRLSPILEGVVRQGMREGTFNTAYPKECLEILLAAS